MSCSSSGMGCSQQPSGCPSEDNCIPGVCPDFTIRRHDTKPAFKVKIEDCDGPLDLTNLVLEASMWANGKIKKQLEITDTYFGLADNIGFNQIMIGDIIIATRTRLPEYMLVTGFDEDDRLILVERGYRGTTPQKWKRGTPIKILKFINAQAQTEMIYQDIMEMDGTTTRDVLTDSFFIYEWGPNDTCLPGCYNLEFKLIKMISAEEDDDDDDKHHHRHHYPEGTLYGPIGPFVPDGQAYVPGIYEVPGSDRPPWIPSVVCYRDLDSIDEIIPDCDGEKIVYSPSVIHMTPSEIVIPNVPVYPSVICYDGMSIIPSFTSPSLIPSSFGCGLGDGVEWIRRFPVDSDGFVIKITDSPTAEW